MSAEESRQKEYYYARRCDQLRSDINQLDRDYDELRILRSKVESYRGDVVQAQTQRKQQLSMVSLASFDSRAYGEYRAQMLELVMGQSYVDVLMKLDRSITAIQREMIRVSNDSNQAEKDLQYAQSMYTYWKNQADLGL